MTSGHAVDIAIGALWAAFGLYWILAAVNVKAGRTRWTRFTGISIAIIAAAAALLRTSVRTNASAMTSPLLQGTGLAVVVLGLAVAVWARLHLGRNWGMPMTEKTEPELITSGPYRRIRHPIYAGMLLGLIGTAIAVSVYWLIAAALALAYFVYSAVREERYLASCFPDAYPGYQRSTRMLIPFVL